MIEKNTWRDNLALGCADATEQREAWAEVERLEGEVQLELALDKCYEISFNNACIAAGIDGLSTLDCKEEELVSIIKAAQIVEQLQEDAEEALERSPYDISPCGECGNPVVCVPEGLALCENCANAADEAEGGE